MRKLLLSLSFACSLNLSVIGHAQDISRALIFPLDSQHNHAPGIVEQPDGSLLVSWYRGSGERKADDVFILGSRKAAGSDTWSEPFLMIDTPGFPDCNTCMMVDSKDRLWLFWPVILANSWESAITNFVVSNEFQGEGVPKWSRKDWIALKPDDFSEVANQKIDAFLTQHGEELTEGHRREIGEIRKTLPDKLFQRLGWQPRCKPTILRSGRIVLPLYTDTYSFSLMALSDDEGQTWRASAPLLGFGNIQPTILERRDGTLVAYMRENGITGRVQAAESTDRGETWGEVYSTELPNPGSGLDGVRLANGNWVLSYNDTKEKRNRLAVSLSEDEGRTWRWTRHLEDAPSGSYHYPAIIQGRNGTIHVVYSYFVEGGKSMKHAAFTEAWIRGE